MTALQTLEYEALLAPCRPRDVIDRQHGATLELFASGAFAAAQLRPERVTVVYQHRGKPIDVGHLTRVWAGTEWIKASFVLRDTAAGLLARETLHHGSPVSIEYEPRRTLNRIGLLDVEWHTEAELQAVAIGIPRSAYDQNGDGGARIVAIRSRQPTQPRTPSSTRPAQPLVRNCGEILRVSAKTPANRRF